MQHADPFWSVATTVVFGWAVVLDSILAACAAWGLGGMWRTAGGVLLVAEDLEAGSAEIAAALVLLVGGVLSLSIAAKDGFPYVLNTIYLKKEVWRDGNMTYMAGVEIVQNVVRDRVDAVHFLKVENRVWIFAFTFWPAVDYLRLMLEDVGDEDILAQVVW